jgi:hypothetical protein
MGTSVRTAFSAIESTKGNGTPGEIRIPDPQIRSLGLCSMIPAMVSLITKEPRFVTRSEGCAEIAFAEIGLIKAILGGV